MKAEDLMIGDWVKFPVGFEKIIDLPYIEGRGICASFAASATLFPVEVDELEPIQLTKEILEKNGMELHEFTTSVESSEGTLYYNMKERCLYAQWGGYSVPPFCRIDYVHELQHVLRLCGISQEIEL